MPPYIPTPPPPYSIGPGDSVQVWNAESPAAGAGPLAGGLSSASQQVALVRVPGENGTSFSVDGYFSAAPGAFEVDVQAAVNDVDSQYQTVASGNLTTVDAVNQTFHFAGNAENARFVRLLLRTLTNAVNVTASIKR
jgi:hypothetical protein